MNPSSSPHNQDLRSLGNPIDQKWAGYRIDHYLSQCFPFLSRSLWKQRCKSGKVIVQGKQAIRGSYQLKVGDQLFHYYPQSQEPPISINVFCFYHHKHLRAMYKPANIPMHEGGLFKQNTLKSLIHNHFGSDWHAVHRLDLETSGIVLCCNNHLLRASLSTLFRYHLINKTYIAIVKAQLTAQKSFIIDAPIGVAQNTTWRTKRAVNYDNGKLAITRFKVLASFGDYSLIKINPIQGKTHQIRIHCSFNNHPIIGDTRYFSEESIFLKFIDKGYCDEVLKAIICPRLCLHASKITIDLNNIKNFLNTHRLYKKDYLQLKSALSTLDHYCDNNPLCFYLPMPDDMIYILKRLYLNRNLPIKHIDTHKQYLYQRKYQLVK